MLLHADITELIIKAFYNVYNQLGYGFLEKVYEKAMLMELQKLGCEVEAQVPIEVYYDDQLIGKYSADMVVNGLVILELKAASALLEEHEAQLLNYLKATNMEVGMLLNFGPTAEFRRKVFTNSRK